MKIYLCIYRHGLVAELLEERVLVVLAAVLKVEGVVGASEAGEAGGAAPRPARPSLALLLALALRRGQHLFHTNTHNLALERIVRCKTGFIWIIVIMEIAHCEVKFRFTPNPNASAYTSSSAEMNFR